MVNILQKVLEHDGHWRPEGADFSVSQLASSSNYQLWLAKNDCLKEYKNGLDLQVASKVGTGFHLLAEEALGDYDILLEKNMIVGLADHTISGTFDVAYDNGLEWIVGDFKTKGTYQMKKFLKGDTSQTRIQLSLYAYMMHRNFDVDMPTKGEVYLIHVGDKGYFSKQDCIDLGLKEKSPVPKYKTVTLDLMSYDEVEAFIMSKMLDVEHEPELDCEKWRCDYCEYNCKRRMN